jgi:predicted N-acetyltransferase YhbS
MSKLLGDAWLGLHSALMEDGGQALLSSQSRGEEDQSGAPLMIRIRPATEADFTALLQIQQAAFGEYANVYQVSGWTTETLDSLRQDAKEKHIFVAEAEGVVVGSVRFWIVAGVCVIRLLSVSPAHQSQGVGKALIREIERVATDAHKFFACTMLRTAKNIHLFMSLGYKAESILPDHYNHLDLICFAKYRESITNATPSPT